MVTAPPATVADETRRLHLVVLRGPQAADAAAGATTFGSWDGFVAAGLRALAFHLTGWGDAGRRALVEQIRRSPWWDRPVWSDDAGASAPWLDGQGRLEQAGQAGERALAVRRSLGLDAAALHFDERVLYFLAQREGAELAPVCDRHSPALYRYPVLELLAHQGEDANAAAVALVRRGLLEPARLIDRTRHCRGCGSAHLHYLDVCPHCSSI